MTTKVEKSVQVEVPVTVAYNQWTQFEDFPQFMEGVERVTQLSEARLEWVAEIAGVKRQWQAKIVEQVPDRKVAWAATEGATNAGAVTFEDAGGGRTTVHLTLEYEPEGLVEKVGDMLNIVERQAVGDLERFKTFIESRGEATGAWRGDVNAGAQAGAPGVEQAAGSQGDSGKVDEEEPTPGTTGVPGVPGTTGTMGTPGAPGTPTTGTTGTGPDTPGETGMGSPGTTYVPGTGQP